jgi:PilZ domain
MARAPRKDIRRHERIPCKLSILLAWTAEDGSDRYARGKCRDVSPEGLRIETVDTIPPQSYVNLRIEKWDLTGSGRVRYTRRGGAANVVGLELTQKIHQQLLDALRQAPDSP